MNDEPKDEISILNTREEILQAMEAEQQARYEAIDQACAEFRQRTGFQDNIYSADELVRFFNKGEDITADNIERAYERRLAWSMPLAQLRRYLEIMKEKE